MGLLNGSASLTRFLVTGELPESFWEVAAQRIAALSFKDIDDTMDEYSIGWVSVADMFDNSFAYSSYAAGDYITLTMRVDERKVASSVLKKFVMKEEERIKREKQIPRLSRSARLEIKERIRAELIRNAPAVPSTYDLCWNLADNTLLFFSTSKKAMALLEEYKKLLEPCGMDIELISRSGRPDYVILNVQDELDCDLIVIGSRGLSVLENVIMGSVVTRVLEGATCPVLVTRNLRLKYLQDACGI